MNVLKDIDIKELIRQFAAEYDKEDVERWILKTFTERIETEGATFARHISNIDMFYHTIKTGVFKKKNLPYLFKEGRLIGYVLNTGKTLKINSPSDFPEDTYPQGEWLPKDRFLIVPIGTRKDIFTQQEYTYGAVVLYREHKDFTNEETNIATLLGYDTGEILDSYLKIKMLEKLRLLMDRGKELNMKALKGKDNINVIIRDFLYLATELIEAAERGSALIETPRGMKFIAAIGYDEEYLLSLPPFPANISKLTWYGLGEDKLKKGIPRIITHEHVKRDPLKDILPDTQQIQANLMIPIVTGSGNLLELNLDNISGNKIFDDMDIEIASYVASFMTTSYELYTREQERVKHISLIKQMGDMLAQFFSSSGDYIVNKDITEIFLDTIKKGLSSLKPQWIMVKGVKGDNTPIILYKCCNVPKDVIEKAQQLTTEIEVSSRQCLAETVERYDVLVVKHNITSKRPCTIYITLIKKDHLWTKADVHHIINAINTSALMVSNIQHLEDIKATQEDTLKMLGKALEYRDLETKGHTERTGYLTLKLAQALHFEDIKGIMWGAYVHDIGKIAIPDYILLKPGKLTKEEFKIMKKHVIYGYEMLKGIRRIPQTTLNVVRFHHEKWDGTGYPEGLKGDQIPLEARIFAVVDVFDALISKRPYKEKWPISQALEIIQSNSGTHFDPNVVKTFFSLIENEDIIKKLEEITQKASTT